MVGYLGDKSRKIVHDLGNMKSDCEIYHIGIKNREYFTPDNLENAKSKSYVECKFCIN